MVTEDAVAETLVCDPDPEKHVEAIKEYADAGYDHICVHQVGPDQKGFLRFFERDGLPELGSLSSGRAPGQPTRHRRWRSAASGRR